MDLEWDIRRGKSYTWGGCVFRWRKRKGEKRRERERERERVSGFKFFLKKNRDGMKERKTHVYYNVKKETHIKCEQDYQAQKHSYSHQFIN